MNNESEANQLNSSSELSAIVQALLDTLDDKNEKVSQVVNKSIHTISDHKPAIVIHAAHHFWQLHRKISHDHLTALLKIIADTCKNHANKLDSQLVTDVANLAVNELTGYAENQSYDILVGLSREHCSLAMEALLTRFEPGMMPHHTIVRAMGMVAAGNPFGTVPFIRITMSVVLPMLPHMHDDELKIAACFMISKFAEAINDYLINMEEASDPGFCKEAYIEDLPAIFDVLWNNWLRTVRDHKIVDKVLGTLHAILPVLPASEQSQKTIKLLPVALHLCRRNGLQFSSTKLLALILDTFPEEEKETLRSLIEQIHNNLFDLICIAPFEVSRDTLLTHYEALQCFRSIVILFPDEGLDRVLQHLKSSMAMHRSRALVILKHLINTLPSEDDAILQRIALTLQDCLTENNAKQMIGTIIALAARPTVPLLPSQRSSFVRYMVIHCGTSSEEAEAYQEALYLLASTVEGAESWLWPCLIKALLDTTYAASVPAILRALSPLASKIVSGDNEQKDFSGIKVLARCLELICEESNRLPVVSFLRNAAPLFGHQLNQLWDEALKDISYFLENDFSNNSLEIMERNHAWEEKLVDFLEQSVLLEGVSWCAKLADELVTKPMSPQLSIILSAICSSESHVIMLVELSTLQNEKSSGEYARAVGISSRRHLKLVLKTMEELCQKEGERKEPVRLLGLVRDSKGVALAEAVKTGLLKSYSEIVRRADAKDIYADVQKHIVPWIIKQLNDCKKATTMEAGLLALEQIGYAIHPNRLPNSTGLKARGKILSTLLALFQSPFGYKPIQLYPFIIKATIALIRIPPALAVEEKEILLSTILDKTIAAEYLQTTSRLSGTLQQVVEELGIVCTEIVGDSANMLAQLVEILMPWMQSNIMAERKTAITILRSTLRTYHDSLKYTFPGGKLEPGKLLGRILSWSADAEYTLRPYVVDCVALSLNIGARHRTSVTDTHLNQDLNEIKKIIISEDNNTLYDAIKILALTACERIATGEVVSLAEGLIENLTNKNETAVAAGIALGELFSIRGSEMPRSNIPMIDTILTKIRQMDNTTCRHIATLAIKSLMQHHPQELVEQMLKQPLPLDRSSEHCWREFGSNPELGLQTLDILLNQLENNFELTKNASPTSPHSVKSYTASLSSLSAIIALGNLLQSATAETLIERKPAELLSILLKYLSGWLHAEAPMSVVNTKFGFIPNRESCKINPCRSVYSVLVNVLTIIDTSEATALLNDIVFDSEQEGENKLIFSVKSVAKCLSKSSHTICEIARILGPMMTSQLPAQRATATAFYIEVIGTKDCDAIWLDAIINALHEAKMDSSPLVRKLATIGLTKIVKLDQKQIDEYFDSCLSALLDGLEETADAGGKEVILESLRGFPVLLSVKTERPISPHIVLAIKPYLEKEDWEMRLAAVSALRSVFKTYHNFSTLPDDDVSDQFLSCLPCFTVKLEDPINAISEAVRNLVYDSASLGMSKTLTEVVQKFLRPDVDLDFEKYLKELIQCLNEELPQRAEELRNSVVMGYSRSEVAAVRATSALILGIFGEPRPEDIQRLLQLLRDQDSIVKIRAAHALALCYTINNSN